MKLWDKNIKTDELIERFTIGRDRELDVLLSKYDVLGSLAHISMLTHVGLLTEREHSELRKELINIYNLIEKESFIIEDGIEDVHSQIEFLLTKKLGDTGKKIHSARSRNDQVILDIKLFVRDELHALVDGITEFFDILINRSNKYKDYLIPGYTHLQVAMPSSFGLWFGAHAENLIDDLVLLNAAYKIADQNPLGSAAGYGSSFPVNRQMTTELLGFASMNYNVIGAQMSRGRTERIVSFALASVAGTLAKMAGDICMFNSQNFGFLTLPDDLTTGSSIMPHKKNPDVFELVRAKCNKIQSLPNEIDHIWINLQSGYFRDMQIIKESFLPVFSEIKNCISIMSYAVSKLIPSENILNDERYKYVFSVEEVNKLVLKGVPFREAYKKVALQIEEGSFNYDKKVIHTHEGSIGNLCNDKIREKMDMVLGDFDFKTKETAFRRLLMR